MKTTLKSLLAAVLVTVGSASGFGQAISLPDIALLEGTVSAVSPVNAAGNVTLTVMGARVTLHPSAEVEGDIHAKSLSVADGASFDQIYTKN